MVPLFQERKKNPSFSGGDTLPKTNKSPLKMVVSNRNFQISRVRTFSGAFAVSFQGGDIYFFGE